MFQPNSSLVNPGKLMIIGPELRFHIELVTVVSALVNVFLPKERNVGFGKLGMDITRNQAF